MAPKIDPKSMENRGCVADAFWERFWVVPDAILGATGDLDLAISATIFDKKSKSDIQKCMQKPMLKKYGKIIKKHPK